MQLTRFLLLSTEFPPGPGGIGQHAWSLAQALITADKTVVVQTEADYAGVDEVNAFDAQYQSERLSIVRNARGGWRTYPDRIKRSRHLIKTHQPDVLILTGRFSIWAGAWLKYWGLATPTWAFVHGSEVGNARRWTTRLTLLALQKTDRIIAVSAFTRSLLPGRLQQKTEVLPNGITTAEIPASDELIGFVNWPGSPRLLTVGRISPRKGQHRVVKALPALLQHFPDLHYHMVGLPDRREVVEDLAKELGVTSHITIHGKLANRLDLYRAYHNADAFIMLSENQPDGDVEGFGIAILEANYFGVPAIGAQGCGIEDAIQHGHNGYLVDGDNAEAVAQALQDCLAYKQQLSTQAKAWAAEHDWNQLAHQLLHSEIR
ncbi:MAG: glycosyltransferase family 4 protein [Saprospiraceae bacterium]|nr:glycosyltransferase family 4 protein [Saprospiraceae bacterium]